MSNHSSGSENSQRDNPLTPARTLSTDALARRRLLLKGATGGTAAMAALTPMGALATVGSTVLVCKDGDGKNHIATVSGAASAAQSFGPNVTIVVATGHKVSYWGSGTSTTPTYTWPSGCAHTTTTSSKLTKCTASWKGNTMLWVTNNSTTCKSDEAHWICAYANANKFWTSTPSTSLFPYSPQQVLDLYNGLVPGVTAAQALIFFKTYTEITA